MFNWLGQDMDGCRCLDLYAGSGALGFEALSRGAERVIMVEREEVVLQALLANARQLDAAGAEIIKADALEFMRRSAGDARFDVIFLDPPFDAGLPAEMWPLLQERLAPGGRVFSESGTRQLLPQGWTAVRTGRAGKVNFQLLQWGTA